MSERTKLLKKAVMTGVGATTNGERIKSALKEAMDDLVKIGQELMDELEEKGKVKTKTAHEFIDGLKEEANRRSLNASKGVSTKVQGSLRKTAKEIGIATVEDVQQLEERIAQLEERLRGQDHPGAAKKDGRKRKGADHDDD